MRERIRKKERKKKSFSSLRSACVSWPFAGGQGNTKKRDALSMQKKKEAKIVKKKTRTGRHLHGRGFFRFLFFVQSFFLRRFAYSVAVVNGAARAKGKKAKQNTNATAGSKAGRRRSIMTWKSIHRRAFQCTGTLGNGCAVKRSDRVSLKKENGDAHRSTIRNANEKFFCGRRRWR